MRWQKVAIHNLCEITSSKRIYVSDYQTDGIPFYRGREISEKFNGNIDVTTELFITKSKYLEIKEKFGIPQPGDLLLTSVGTLGNPYVVKEGEVFYFKDGNLTWFRNFKGLESKYLYYWIVSPQGKAELKKCTIGSSQSAFPIVLLKDMQIALPPIPIQRHIADILSTYDDLIENNTRRIRTLEQMAQAIYQEWFGKVEKESLPKGWEVMAYTDAIDVMSGGTPRTSIPEYWDGDIPWFTPQDLDNSFYVLDTKRKITELGLSKCNSKLYPENAVFITARGTVGKIVLASVPMAMSQTNYALIGKNGASQFWVYLMTKELVDIFKKKATGAVFDTIVVDTFRQQEIIKPKENIIEKFHLEVEPIFNLLKNLQLKNVNLRQARDLLLPRLVSGEIDVSDLNDN